MNDLPVAVVTTKRVVCNLANIDLDAAICSADWQFHVDGVFDDMEKAWKCIEKLYSVFLRDASVLNWKIDTVHIFDASTTINEVCIEYIGEYGCKCATIYGVDRTRVV